MNVLPRGLHLCNLFLQLVLLLLRYLLVGIIRSSTSSTPRPVLHLALRQGEGGFQDLRANGLYALSLLPCRRTEFLDALDGLWIEQVVIVVKILVVLLFFVFIVVLLFVQRTVVAAVGFVQVSLEVNMKGFIRNGFGNAIELLLES